MQLSMVLDINQSGLKTNQTKMVLRAKFYTNGSINYTPINTAVNSVRCVFRYKL